MTLSRYYLDPKRIKDTLHGEIPLPQADLDIIDDPLFQRLRNIKQLGQAHFTYPGATHTRFEHSIGAAHIASTILDQLRAKPATPAWGEEELDENEFREIRRTARFSGLLHDIGHTPFSHTLEPFLKEFRGGLVEFVDQEINIEDPFSAGRKSSTDLVKDGSAGELLSCRIILDEEGLRPTIADHDVQPERLAAAILGCVRKEDTGEIPHYAVLGPLISSSIDADKFDYLARDDLRTAADVAGYDMDRLLNSYTVTSDHQLTLDSKAASVISNLINGRTQAHMWIYQHHKVVYADALLHRCVDLVFENYEDIEEHLSPDAILEEKFDDHDIIQLIRKYESEDELQPRASRLRGRDFLKSPWKNALEYSKKVRKSDGIVRRNLGTFLVDATETPKEVERRLANEIGLPQKDILVDVARFSPFSSKKDIPVRIDDTLKWALEDLQYQSPFTYEISDPETKGGSLDTVPYVFLPKEHHQECVQALYRYEDL